MVWHRVAAPTPARQTVDWRAGLPDRLVTTTTVPAQEPPAPAAAPEVMAAGFQRATGCGCGRSGCRGGGPPASGHRPARSQVAYEIGCPASSAFWGLPTAMGRRKRAAGNTNLRMQIFHAILEQRCVLESERGSACALLTRADARRKDGRPRNERKRKEGASVGRWAGAFRAPRPFPRPASVSFVI